MAGQSSISGLALAEIAAGLVLAWSGIENVSIQQVIKSFVSGKLPTAGPAVTYATPASTTSSAGTTTVPGSGYSASSYAACKAWWILAGGSVSSSTIAAAIPGAESGYNVEAVQQGQPYATTGWGLWQITPGDSEPSVGINSALLHGITNARAAVLKYKQAGNSFSPWTTYTSGAYLAYLPSTLAPASLGEDS